MTVSQRPADTGKSGKLKKMASIPNSPMAQAPGDSANALMKSNSFPGGMGGDSVQNAMPPPTGEGIVHQDANMQTASGTPSLGGMSQGAPADATGPALQGPAMRSQKRNGAPAFYQGNEPNNGIVP